MKQLRTSETRIIRRTQINLNPLNPKKHTDEAVKLQRKNLEKVGYLGGIVWNEVTGNLIDGHRRIHAMDAYYRFDGTKNDYDVKVEVVSMKLEDEKQQLAYMAVGDTKADMNLLAEFAADIDISEIGLTGNEEEQLQAIFKSVNDMGDISIVSMDTLIDEPEESEAEEMTEEEKFRAKQKIKANKQEHKEAAIEAAYNETAYLTISFSTYEGYLGMCEMFGHNPEEKFMKGEELMAKLNE